MPEAYLEKFIAHLQAREKLYRKLLPYDDPNFGTDPYWIRAYPFRQAALPGAPVEIEARVLNHAARPKNVRVLLNLQPGWKGIRPAAEQQIPARTEGRLRLSAMAPSAISRRRHVLGLSATVDGQPLGEFSAAIVDVMTG